MARKLKSDRVLFITTILLVGLSIVMVYSASAVVALERYGGPSLFLVKQGMWAALEIPSEQAAVEYEDRQQIMATFGAAPPEAVTAFLEKRPARFQD